MAETSYINEVFVNNSCTSVKFAYSSSSLVPTHIHKVKTPLRCSDVASSKNNTVGTRRMYFYFNTYIISFRFEFKLVHRVDADRLIYYYVLRWIFILS